MALKGYSSLNTAEQQLLSTTPVIPVTASLIAPPIPAPPQKANLLQSIHPWSQAPLHYADL